MDLTQDTKEISVFTVCLWKSGGNTQNYVFVGRKHSRLLMDTLQKYETPNVILTQEDKTTLKASFGKNFMRKLSLNDREYPPIYIKERIYQDDNILQLQKKVCKYIQPQSVENKVFLWMKRCVLCTDTFLTLLIEQIFKDRQLVTVATVKKILDVLIDDDSQIQFDTNKVNKVQLFETLKNMFGGKTVVINEPLGKRYTDEVRYNFYFQCNPFLNTTIPADGYRVYPDRSRTIESFNLVENCIYMTTMDDLQEQGSEEMMNLYFPWRSQPIIQTEQDNEIFSTAQTVQNDVLEKIRNIKDDPRNNPFDVKYTINHLHLRFNEHLNGEDVNLSRVFEGFSTSYEVPFLKFHSVSKQPQYKIFRAALSSVSSLHKISPEDLKEWVVKTPAHSRAKSLDHIVFKVFFSTINGKNKFISVSLFEDGHIDIKYQFFRHESVEIKDVTRNLKKINECLIKYLQENVKSLNYIDPSFWVKEEGLYDNVKIVAMSLSYNVSNTKKGVNMTTLKLMATQTLFPFFSELSVQNSNEDVVQLLYKRIDNFVKLDNIKFFLNKKNSMNDEEKIDQLQKRFGISQEEAEKAFSDWKSSQKVELVQIGKGFYYRPAHSENVAVSIKPSSLSLTVSIEGITRLSYAQRIISLVKFLYVYHDKPSSLSFVQSNIIQPTTYDDVVYAQDENTEQPTLTDILEQNMMDIDANSSDDGSFSPALSDLADNFDLNALQEPIENEQPSQQKADGEQTITNEEVIDVVDVARPYTGNMKNYIIDQLKQADPKLFTEKMKNDSKTYATSCQSSQKRQPIVISNEEFLQMDKTGIINNLRYGTDTERRKKNVYICPQVWCPYSRKAMTKEAFEASGKKCPDPNDTPIVVYENKYWTSDKKNKNADKETSPAKIGFVSGTCFPCCFKYTPTRDKTTVDVPAACKDNVLKEDDAVTAIPPTDVASSSVKKKDDVLNNYIATTTIIPATANKMAILPNEVSTLFKNTIHTRGAITNKVDGFIRKGVASSYQETYHTQPFLTLIASLLSTTLTDVKLHLVSQISKKTFVLCQSGNLVSMFLDDNRNIHNPTEYENFHTEFFDEKNTGYITDFKLYDLDKFLHNEENNKNISFEDFKSLKVSKPSIYKKILREYLIYNAFSNFKKFIKDDSITKTHEPLLELILQDKKLNASKTNIVVFTFDPDKKSVSVDCLPWIKDILDMTKPFMFLIKSGAFYEVIYHIKARSSSDFSLNARVLYHNDERVKDIVDFYVRNCGIIAEDDGANKFDSRAICTYLNVNNMKTHTQVLDYNHKLHGFIVNIKKGSDANIDGVTNPKVFVPCKDQPPLFDVNTRFIYVDELLKNIDNDTKAEAQKLFSYLYEITQEPCYKVKKRLPHPEAFIMEDDTFVPLSKTPRQDRQELYLQNLNIFIGWQDIDKRKIIVNHENVKNVLFDVIKTEMLDLIKKTPDVMLKDEMKFLQDEENMFPFTFKLKKMQQVVREFLLRVVSYGIVSDDLEYDNTTRPPSKCSGLKKNVCSGICQWVENQKNNNGKCMVMLPNEWSDLFVEKLSYLLLKSDSSGLYDTTLSRGDASNDTKQLVFTQKEVDNGKLSKIEGLIRNPYIFASQQLDKYIRELLDRDIVVKPRVLLTDLLKSVVWDEVPTFAKKDIFLLHKTFKIEDDPSGWCVNETAKEDRDFLLNLFIYIARSLNFKGRIDKRIIDKVVENRVIEQYRNNGINFVKDMRRMNSSFDGIYRIHYLKKGKPTPEEDDDATLATYFGSHQAILDIMGHRDYRWSQFEMSLAAEMFDVNFFVLRRRKEGVRDHTICIRTRHNTDKYIILREVIEDSSKYMAIPYEKYDIVVKNKNNPQVLFSVGEYENVDNYIKDSCAVLYFDRV